MQTRRYPILSLPFLLCVAALAACAAGRPSADTLQSYPARVLGPLHGKPAAPPWQFAAPESAVPGQGAADWRNGDYAKAVADENIAIRWGQPQAEDYAIRANSEAATEHLPQAWADFQMAIQMNPAIERTDIDFGVWLDRAHQPTRGVRVLTAATHILPRSAGCWGLLGWLQYQAGQYPQSIASSRRSESLDAGQPYVRYNQALCFAAMGDSPRSAAAYRRALAFGSDANRQAALMEIRNALRKHPTSASLRQAEAMLHGPPG